MGMYIMSFILLMSGFLIMACVLCELGAIVMFIVWLVEKNRVLLLVSLGCCAAGLLCIVPLVIVWLIGRP